MPLLQVKNFEPSHHFQTSLEKLKQQKDTDDIQEVDGVLDGRHGAKGKIIFSSDLNRVQQVAIAKVLNFREAFFKTKTWQEIPDEFGHEVLPEKLVCSVHYMHNNQSLNRTHWELGKIQAPDAQHTRCITVTIMHYCYYNIWKNVTHVCNHVILLLMFNSDTLPFLQVKNFEQSHHFQTSLERLKQQKDTDEIQEVDGVLDGIFRCF